MHELNERELFEAIHYAKSIDEETGAKIVEQFQLEQSALAETLFSLFPAFIAEQHPEMAYLFMDLCFDVLCVFQQAFGSLPSQSEMDVDWVERQAVLLDAELQALMTDRTDGRENKVETSRPVCEAVSGRNGSDRLGQLYECRD